VRKRMELQVSKPHLRGQTTKDGRVLWCCTVTQMIGEMPVIRSRGKRSYKPEKAYRLALKNLRGPDPLAEAVARLLK
jgi:hypothetical protein